MMKQTLIKFILFITGFLVIVKISNYFLFRKIDHTCEESYIGRIKKIERDKGFANVVLENDHNLFFSIEKQIDRDSFMKQVKVGFLLQKNSRSNLLYTENNLDPNSKRIWTLSCHCKPPF